MIKNSCDVKKMLESSYQDPCFFVNFYNLGRGLIGDAVNDIEKPYIKKSKNIKCWRTVHNTLEKFNFDTDILFDHETYLILWTFDCVINKSLKEETVFYYWKGNNATKGNSPLPDEIENQNIIIKRVSQWSEPALFFHVFSCPLIVFHGKQNDFNPNVKRLFIVRGELQSEIHLYEIQCSKENLRSRAIFLLIVPEKDVIFYWYGSAVPTEYRKLVRDNLEVHNVIKKANDNWTHFKLIELEETTQDVIFCEAVDSENCSYFNIEKCLNFAPRLFYLNSITGEFLATEVEYPLQSSKHIAPFPFLQSHLYTADQPALFLIDNGKEVWLWEGWKTSESNLDLFEVELHLAKQIANNCAKEKEKYEDVSIPVRHVKAGSEPIKFRNIFPYWIKMYTN